MKVKELIEKLQQFDGDLPVYCEVSYDSCIEKVLCVMLCTDNPNSWEPEQNYIYIVPNNN